MVQKLSTDVVPAALAGPHGALMDAGEARQIFDGLQRGVCIIEPKFSDAGQCVDYVFVDLNAAFEEQTGLVRALGRSMRELRPDHEQHWFDIYGEIARTGTPKRFTAEAAALNRWYDVYAFRLGSAEDNRVAIVFDDITERRRLEERYALVSREIEHRFRNLFSQVTSLVRLTRSDSLADYKAALLRRFTALFASTTNIGRSRTATSDFAELVRIELAPYQAEGRIVLAGAAVLLDDSVQECLSVVLHELATNAVKYGALSSPHGKVSIRWRNEGGLLRVKWQESDGPRLDGKPARLGIGATVVERCIREQLKGEITFDWRAQGLVSEFAVPVIRPQKGVPN